jgi:hypothetical protein
VLTDLGPVDNEESRDRDEPSSWPSSTERQVRLDGIDAFVLSLSARELITGEIAAHVTEVHGAKVTGPPFAESPTQCWKR